MAGDIYNTINGMDMKRVKEHRLSFFTVVKKLQKAYNLLPTSLAFINCTSEAKLFS